MAETYMRKVIPVTRMDCPTCVATIEKELAKLEGVKGVHVNFLMKKIIVDYDPEKVDVPKLEERVERLGYRIAYKKYESLSEKLLKVFRGRKPEEEVVFRRLGDHDFEELVLRSNKPVMVLFSSSKCPTCNLMRPKLKEVERKFKDRIYVYELNILEARKWEDYNVMSVPALIYFDGGKEKEHLIGLVEREDVETKVLELLKP